MSGRTEKGFEGSESHINKHATTDSQQSEKQAPAMTKSESTKPWWHSIRERGSALQIAIAAALAIAIGVSITTTVDEIPEAVPASLSIPGSLWLRALRATVLPLIICAMILAVQSLKDMTRGGAVLARWTIGYYIATTLIAIVHSIIMVDLVWRKLIVVASDDSLGVTDEDATTILDRQQHAIHAIVVDMFESLIPANIVDSLANDGLLAVLVSAVVVGYLIPGPNSSLLRGIREVEKIITAIITFLIKMAPIGVFFLILPNLFRLQIADIG